MSYDIHIKVKVQDKPIYVNLGVGWANITWNVRELIKQSSGWDIQNEASNGNVLEWEKKIKRGIKELENNPMKYKKYEASNGWGTVEGTLDFYKRCLDIVKNFMFEYEELCDCAVVWVS